MADSCQGDSSCNNLSFPELTLVFSADFVSKLVQSPCCNSCLFFTMLSPLLMHILRSRSVRIAIILSSPQCLSALTHGILNCSLWPYDLLPNRSSCVFAWPSFEKKQGNQKRKKKRTQKPNKKNEKKNENKTKKETDQKKMAIKLGKKKNRAKKLGKKNGQKKTEKKKRRKKNGRKKKRKKKKRKKKKKRVKKNGEKHWKNKK